MIIDLRSDTVTRPTPEMMQAMARAPLGDDVLGDDPTVHELEEETAALLGHEAAVFVPSGTMANQIALACHCHRGDSVLFDQDAHMLFYEVGAPAVIAQVLPRGVPSNGGVMAIEDIERLRMSYSLHTPPTTLLCIENTHNRAGGASIPLLQLKAYRDYANSKGLRLHLDGARIANAAAWEGVAISEITTLFDSVSICLSKGLGAPVGSVLVGTRDYIYEARRWRKRLGGGMRQAGLLAACGLFALRVNLQRISEDHVRARSLAESLSRIEGLHIDLGKQCTNFVMVGVPGDAAEWCQELKKHDVLCLPFGAQLIRLVTHLDFRDEHVGHAVEAFQAVANASKSRV